MKQFFRRADAKRRLDGAVCLYDGEPHVVYVDGGENFADVVQIRKIPFTSSDSLKNVKYTDEKFSISFPNIGYCNIDSGARYLCRFPKRVQRTGLHVHNVFDSSGNFISSNLFNSKGFSDMLLNKYPSYSEALEILDNVNVTSVAFHKDFAIEVSQRDLKSIYFKEKLLAIQTKRNSDFQFIDQGNLKFIKSVLNRVGVYTQ